MVIRSVRLTSTKHFGKRLPGPASAIIGSIAELASQAGTMAFRGRSSGRRPPWLKAATDIRFVGAEGTDETVLFFETPTFGEAAPKEYAQLELWPTRTNSSDTGFEFFADIIQDFAQQNRDSDKYDKSILKKFHGLREVFNDKLFQSMTVPSNRSAVVQPALFTTETLKTVKMLYETTPGPRRVKIYGMLDMLRASTQRFGLKLPSGEEAQGLLVEGSILDLQGLLNQPVIVFGKAVYRASGNLLRIDAEKVEVATDADQFFGKIPKSIQAQPKPNLAHASRGKKGIEVIFGQWPGNESDEQIKEALQRLS